MRLWLRQKPINAPLTFGLVVGTSATAKENGNTAEFTCDAPFKHALRTMFFALWRETLLAKTVKEQSARHDYEETLRAICVVNALANFMTLGQSGALEVRQRH